MQTKSSLSPLYHELSDLEILKAFNSDLDKGLTAEEVARRLEKYGFNELEVKQGKPAWLRLLLQFHQPLLYILLIAGTIKALLGSMTNAGVIWGVT
ncbi:MAG: cation-transporting P-type ATPase, partial [Crocosphaera sp.]